MRLSIFTSFSLALSLGLLTNVSLAQSFDQKYPMDHKYGGFGISIFQSVPLGVNSKGEMETLQIRYVSHVFDFGHVVTGSLACQQGRGHLVIDSGVIYEFASKENCLRTLSLAMNANLEHEIGVILPLAHPTSPVLPLVLEVNQDNFGRIGYFE